MLAPLIRAALTERQADVAECLVEGLTDPEIAVRVGMSPRTVKSHLRNLYDRYIERSNGKYRRILLIRLLLCK